MLRKNVYIVYPAGYHGNYLKWAIESSDVDMMATGDVPTNPINKSNSSQWGGVGTSHKSVRIPTHARLLIVRRWIYHNRPSIKKVYVINAGTTLVTPQVGGADIADLLIQDPTGIVISLHDNNDQDISMYGVINAVTKWPTNVAVSNALGLNGSTDQGYDPFNCASDLTFRNKAALGRLVFGVNHIIPEQAIQDSMDKNDIWYESRRLLQPHEMEPGNYPHHVTWRDRYFAMSCMDIVSPDFPDKLQEILNTTGISDNFSLEPMKAVHQEYVDIQPNLQWFDSIKKWEEDGKIDDYIRSHAIIQSEILRRMFIESNTQEVSYEQKQYFMYMYYTLGGDNWPHIKSEQEFFSLPEYIKTELLDRGLKLNYTGPAWPKMSALNWQELSIDEINDVFQQEKSIMTSAK